MINSVKNNNIFGVFEDEDILLTAMKKIKAEGINIKNVFTPYPIHEVFHEMKLKTRLPYAAFGFGVFGLFFVYALLYWTSVINYPIVIGGKPHNTLSFIIILFVMTICVGVILSLIAFFVRQKLGPGKKAVIVHKDITDDKFVIVIEKTENMSKDDTQRINSLLFEAGAIETGEKENVENI